MKVKKFLIWLFVLVVLNGFSALAESYIEIPVTEKISFDSISVSDGDSIFIFGASDAAEIRLPAVVSLKGDLKIDNVTLVGSSTIYANGYKLYIGENVTSTDRLTVYGGANGYDVSNTDLKLYGGLYNNVYGGGLNSKVNGNTNLVFGGNCNIGDGIDDTDEESVSPCFIYGGGNNGAVTGSTTIVFEGNAVAKYVFGAGIGEDGTVYDTNIFINGGKIMNVYGGTTDILLSECNTHITMTGGVIESVFGGSSKNSLTGSTYVKLLGGEVTRRVYSGCYNEWSISFKSDYHVNGTTTLVIGKDVILNSKSGLALGNQSNIGVFAGSRLGKNGNANEINTIIFLDGCYSAQSNKIGEKSLFSVFFYSNQKYTVACSSGGDVVTDVANGKIYCYPDFGKYLSVNGKISLVNETALTEGSVLNVDFYDDFAIKSIEKNDDGNITVNVVCENVRNEASPALYITVSDTGGKLKAIYIRKTEKEISKYTVGGSLGDLNNLRISAYILNGAFAPLCRKFVN